MFIEHTIQGFTIISDIIDGYRVTRKYMDYSESDAKAMFRAEFNLDDDYEG